MVTINILAFPTSISRGNRFSNRGTCTLQIRLAHGASLPDKIQTGTKSLNETTKIIFSPPCNYSHSNSFCQLNLTNVSFGDCDNWTFLKFLYHQRKHIPGYYSVRFQPASSLNRSFPLGANSLTFGNPCYHDCPSKLKTSYFF